MTNQSGSGFVLISCLISPVGFYRLGKWLMIFFHKDESRQKLFLLSIICYLFPLFVLTIKDVALVGIVNTSRALLGDLSNSNTLAATLYGMMASIGIGCISVLFAQDQRVWSRLAYFLLSLCSVFVVIHLVNRTGIVIFICCVFVSFIISSKMNISKIFTSLFIVGLLALIILNTSVISEDMIDAYQQRELSSTADAAQLGGRTAIWIDALNKLVSHPFGWVRERYAHNLWLDIARVGGWISLLLFLVPTLVWCKNYFHLARKKVTPFVLILLSINLAMFLSSFVEPVIEGSILFFSLLMMIWGCTTSLSKERIVS